MSINNPFRTDSISINQTELAENRQKLKKIAWESIAELPASRAKILLADMGPVESFLLEVINEQVQPIIKKIHPLRYINDSNTSVLPLQEVVGGMINMTPLSKIKEILENPDEFLCLLKGELYVPPKTQEEQDFIPERPATLEQIRSVLRFEWENLGWGTINSTTIKINILKTTREVFRQLGLEVKVEFFRPNDKKHEQGDYIVIVERTQGLERGIVVPRYGIALDVEMTLDLFQGFEPGVFVTKSNLVSFPKVQRMFTDTKEKNTEWKVVECGVLSDFQENV